MTFPAKYSGRCAGECGERIKPGDSVEFVDDELVHEGCAPAPDGERPTRPVCPSCFVEIALNGACAC